MNITGMVRVKNGERWLADCLHSMLQVCDHVVVMDDGSTDSTVTILDSLFPDVIWFGSPFTTLNEARDKTVLLANIRLWLPKTEWVLAMDADEVLLDPAALLMNIQSDRAPAYSRRILTLWDRPTQIRVDGIYGDLWRGSIFRLSETNGVWQQQSPAGPNLHCGSVPTDLQDKVVRCDPEVRIAHYGSMTQADRVAKYKWYLDNDSQNVENEDHYHHAVQGDLAEFPARAIYRHGGPLRLEEWKP